MNYFYIEPEVAGGLGENTILDHSVHPPRVERLNYEFDGWLGDGLLEAFPCLIVTRGGADAIEAAKLTGVEFAEVEVSVSEQFQMYEHDVELPPFVWLRVSGVAGRDDFGIAVDLRYVLSQRALDALQPVGLDHADIEPFDVTGQ
jgi:hypothetical protein